MPTKITYGTPTRDILQLLDGRDTAVAYDNIVYGNGGGDAITGGSGNDWIWGAASDASLTGVADTFIGGAGDDVIISWANNSLLSGGDGNDILIFSGPLATAASFATLQGGDGNDQLWALGGGVLYGGNGDDTLVGGGYLDGGYGNDLLIATTNSTTAYGSVGDDTLYAAPGVGAAVLNGGIGADVIVGNGQYDRLIAGNDKAQDILIGGPGKDEFDEGGQGIFTNGYLPAFSGKPELYPSAAGLDVIWNFQIGLDDLVIPTESYYGDMPYAPGVVGSTDPATTGYNADLGLSGTLIRLDYVRGISGNYFHQNVVFLAGITTDIQSLIAAGSLHFNDAVATY